jgi:TP53 regulating kinase-like protein
MIKEKIIHQGAEAKIILFGNLIIKDRIKKSYRLPQIDEKIRKQRTKNEKKLLEKASKIINAPDPFPLKDFNKIEMPFIEGKKLSDSLNSFSLEKQSEICRQIGKEIAKLHEADIIHGDLTTSNMIYKENQNSPLSNNKIYFIDFGLGFVSKRIEDKAVDLHLLRQALEAKHFEHWEILFEKILEGYKNYPESKKVLERLKAVEKRGRYKN